MKTVLLAFLTFFFSTALLAQQGAFEQQQVLLADGRELMLWISLDETAEELQYKVNEGDEPAIIPASEVVNFNYGGFQYYTLPLRDDYYTFFKVQYEGKEFAMLEKEPSYKTLRTVVNASNGSLALRRNKNNESFSLCFVASYEDMEGNMEFEVDKLIFLAVEDELKLCYMITDQYHFLWDDLIGEKPGKRTVENMFEAMVKSPKKVNAIQQKVKQDNLNVRDPRQLIRALGAVYQ